MSVEVIMLRLITSLALLLMCCYGAVAQGPEPTASYWTVRVPFSLVSSGAVLAFPTDIIGIINRCGGSSTSYLKTGGFQFRLEGALIMEAQSFPPGDDPRDIEIQLFCHGYLTDSIRYSFCNGDACYRRPPGVSKSLFIKCRGCLHTAGGVRG